MNEKFLMLQMLTKYVSDLLKKKITQKIEIFAIKITEEIILRKEKRKERKKISVNN